MKKILVGEKKGKWAEVMPTQCGAITQQSVGNKFHTVSVNVWSRSNAAKRYKTLKLVSCNREYAMP
jgi:hypothetical protein